MAFDPQGFQIADAVATGQDVYEVQFPFWGVRTVAAGQAAVNVNFQFPPPGQPAIPLSLAGIAIGPRSTVDRAWVSWSRQLAIGPSAVGIAAPKAGTPTTRTRPMSVGHPLMFAQATALGAVPTNAASVGPADPNNSPVYAMQTGLLYVWPKEPALNPGLDAGADFIATTAQSTTILPAEYADQAGNVWNLSGAAAPFTVFRPPYLELYLYLRPPLFAPPTARFPLCVSDSIAVTVSGSFQPVDIIPIFGRKHVTVGLRSNDVAANTTFQLGLLNCVRENGPATTSPPFELPAGTTAALVANQTAIIQLANPCSDYLIVYAKVQGVATVDVQVSAYD